MTRRAILIAGLRAVTELLQRPKWGADPISQRYYKRFSETRQRILFRLINY